MDAIVDVVMPQMGETVSEATVARWLKREGEQVSKDEPLLEIATEKVDTEIGAPSDGVVARVLVAEGLTVAVGTRLAVIAPVGVDIPPESLEKPPAAATEEAATPATVVTGTDRSAPANADEGGLVSPVVARIAAELGLDLGVVPGTGRGGRVTKRDILAYAENRAELAPAELREPTVAVDGVVTEQMSQMRRTIAEHMLRSLTTSAHLTTVFEVDMSQVVAIRDSLRPDYERMYGLKLSYLPFIARAAIDALRSWPWLNGELSGDTIITRNYVNLGIAVALDGGKGLIVPAVKNAQELRLVGLTRAISNLVDRARSKTLMPDDVQGGTFTITNPGTYGSILATPIINQPQVGILDVEAVVKRIVVVSDEHGNDAAAIRPMMNLCLSFDHRLVDGAYAAQYLRDVRDNLQTWDATAY